MIYLTLEFIMSEEQYKNWFNHVDADGSGALAYSELYDFLTSQRGYTESQVQVRR